MEQKEKAEEKEKEEQIAYEKMTPEQKDAAQKQREIVMKEIAKRKTEAILKDLPPALYLINVLKALKKPFKNLTRLR